MSDEVKNGYSNMYKTIGNDHQSLAIKFNTVEVKRNLIFYLKGIGQTYTPNKDGEVEMAFEEVGSPKVNDSGLQSIMMMVESLFNTQIVQGNFSDNEYNSIVADFHNTIYHDLAVNRKLYELKERDYNTVVFTITNMIRAFLTRPIGDNERKHNSNVQVKETIMGANPQQNKQRRFLFF